MTPALLAELKHVKANDGCFWMEFTDFCAVWSKVEIIRLMNDPVEAKNRKQKKIVLLPGQSFTDEDQQYDNIQKCEWTFDKAISKWTSDLSGVSNNNKQYKFTYII